MNNDKALVWVIVVILFIGGIVYFSTSSPSGEEGVSQEVSDEAVTQEKVSSKTPSTPKTSVSSTGAQSGSATLGNLLAQGGNRVCTYSETTQVGRTDANVYVSGVRMHAVYTTHFNAGEKVESHVLYLAGMVYGWTSTSAQGYKSPTTALEVGSTLGFAGSAGYDYSRALPYNCQGWGGDATLFSMPAGVVFTNI